MSFWNYLLSRRPRGGDNSPLNSPSRPAPKRRNLLPSPGTKPVPKDVATCLKLHDEFMGDDIEFDSDSFDILPPPETRGYDSITGIKICDNKDLATFKYRSSSDVEKGNAKLLHGMSFPAGMPLGPRATFDELFDELNYWAKDLNTAGGSFALSKNSIRRPTKVRGPQQLIICSRGGTSRSTLLSKNPADVARPSQKPTIKTGCPWAVWTEEIDIGWVVTHPTDNVIKAALNRDGGRCSCLVHNHELIQST